MSALETMRSAIRKGFIGIFSANFVNRLILFGYSAFFSHFFDRSLWNSYSYANNILAYFLLLQGFGAPSGVIQFCSAAKSEGERLGYLKYAFRIGFLANIFAMTGVLLFASLFNLRVPGSREILLLLCLQPIVQIGFDIFQTYFRSTLRNRQFGWVSVGQSIPFLFLVIGLGYFFQIPGIVVGKYLSYLPALILGILFLGPELRKTLTAVLPGRTDRRHFLHFSFTSALTTSVSQILLLVDVTIIGQMLPAYAGAYSNASRIPFNLYFIPASVVMFAYPYFVKMSGNTLLVKQYFYRMQRWLIALNILISAVLIACAPWLIPLIWGGKYHDSVLPFQILMLGYFVVGTFRIPAGNVIASLGKVKINFYNNILSLALNIVLEILFIGYGIRINGAAGGMMGAAIATVTVYIITSAVGNLYLVWYFKRHLEKAAS